MKRCPGGARQGVLLPKTLYFGGGAQRAAKVRAQLGSVKFGGEVFCFGSFDCWILRNSSSKMAVSNKLCKAHIFFPSLQKVGPLH